MNAATLHPFEAAGMGRGPYAFAGLYDLGEAMNPDNPANFGRLTGCLTDAPKLKAGMGTCACCGHAITVICIVKDADGDLWGVGSDCVEKTSDPHIGHKAGIAIARRVQAKRRMKVAARREAARKAHMAEIMPDGRTRAEHAQELAELQQRQYDAAKAARVERERVWKSTIDDLRRSKSTFLHIMAETLISGPLTERQADCVAKHFHRRGTPGHTELQTRLMTP